MVPAYRALALVTVGITLLLALRNLLVWDMMLHQWYSSCGTWWHTCRNQISSFPETDESIQIGGGVSSVDCLAAEVCASALVMLDIPRSEEAWKYWLPTPFASFPFTSPPRASPYATRFRKSSTTVQLKNMAVNPTSIQHYSNALCRPEGSCPHWNIATHQHKR